MTSFNVIQLYTDGGSRQNPGPGSIGIVIYDGSNRLLYEFSECIGHCTNNQAEYKALIKGLDLAARYTRREVKVFCDSELVMKQMNKVYRLKNDALRDLYHEVKKREEVFDSVIYQHVPRTNQRISKADTLNKQAQNGQEANKCHVEP
jgi:ribonuclease HI